MVSQAGNSDNLMKEDSEMPGRRPKNVVTRRPSNNNNNGQQPGNSAVDDANMNQDTIKRFNISILPPARVRNNRRKAGAGLYTGHYF